MRAATLTVDLAKIESNARRVVEALGTTEVVGVTKVTCGSPEVARAMLAGGVTAIADSRVENLARLRNAGVDAPLWLLRSPAPELAEEAVHTADVSLESEIGILRVLDAAAGRLGVRHAVVLMVDLGDLREGILPERLPELLDGASALPSIDLLGIGTSLTCYGAVVPDAGNLGELVALAEAAERRLGRGLRVSGGMSSSLDALVAGALPARIDDLRIGESIILGVSTVTRERILGLHTDALALEAPVIECALKPSAPRGTIAQDAFGNRPVFADRGPRWRAICAIGRQDAPAEGLVPRDERIEVLGASSDHLICDVHDLPAPPGIGEAIAFTPNYAATLAAFTSPYVRKVFVDD